MSRGEPGVGRESVLGLAGGPSALAGAPRHLPNWLLGLKEATSSSIIDPNGESQSGLLSEIPVQHISRPGVRTP